MIRTRKVLSKVKCFSIISAPNATAEIEVSIPIVWSEKPTGSLNFSLIINILFKLHSSALAGYFNTQCNSAIFIFFYYIKLN